MAGIVFEDGWERGGDIGIDRWGEPVLPVNDASGVVWEDAANVLHQADIAVQQEVYDLLFPQGRPLEQRRGQAHGTISARVRGSRKLPGPGKLQQG